MSVVFFFNQATSINEGCTGQLRYLEFQGNGENTSSFPKFEIANYDVTRTFVKSALLQNVCTLVIRCVPPAHFTHKYRGQIMGAVSTTDKTFEPFSEWDFSLKKHFRGTFQLTEC